MKNNTVICNIVKKLYVMLITAAYVMFSLPAMTVHAEENIDINQIKAYTDQIAYLTNKARKEAGLNELYIAPVMSDIADVRVKEISFNFSNDRPDGTNFDTVIFDYLPDFKRAGENIAGGSDNPEDAFNQLNDSDNGCRILNENYTHMGIGVFYDANSEYKWYWCQVFIEVDYSVEGQYIPKEPSKFQYLADQVISMTNEARAELGLEELYAVPVLNEVSEIRAEESQINFSHTRPDGTKFYNILDEYMIDFNRAGENIACGSETAERTFGQWKGSEAHWHGITNEKFTHIGVGVSYTDEDEYGWYWCQIFIDSDVDMEGQYKPEKEQDVNVIDIPYGDLNGDSAINSFDLMLLMKYLNNDIDFDESQLEASDCLDDGNINIADAIVLKRYILRQCDKLPI